MTFYVLRSSFSVPLISLAFWPTTRLERLVPAENVVVARTFQELEAWQLANEVKCLVFALTESGPASRDFEFRDQIRGSAASAPRNIAEGFGRFRPKEFARGCEVANGELQETEHCLGDGKERKYFTPADANPVIALVKRARMVNTRLLLYLRTCPEPKPRRRPKREP